jgi:predicted ribonuclease YlaK
MYNLVVTVISLQGSTLKNTFGVIDNTRNIQAGELMTALARFESVKNVMILHPITTLNELKRDCTVNLAAVKYDKFMREMFDEKCRLAEQCDKKMNPQLDILKYILKTNEYVFA